MKGGAPARGGGPGNNIERNGSSTTTIVRNGGSGVGGIGTSIVPDGEECTISKLCSKRWWRTELPLGKNHSSSLESKPALGGSKACETELER